jgi:ActR/RegA family two-component response regulator
MGDRLGEQEANLGVPSLHVLVVDDDAAVRKACCDIVERRGSAAMGAESVAAARAILKHQKIDLLLLDLKLPDGGGLTLLEQVKMLYPDTSVVVMTAFATVASAVEAMRIGAGDYLTKPFCVGGADDGAGAGRAAAPLRPAEPSVARETAVAEGCRWSGRAVSGDGEALPDSVEGGLLDASGDDPG